jgi:TIR domain
MVRREQYEGLARLLRGDARPRIEMTFAEVARAIGEELPRSAYQHSAWWGSDRKHTQAVWLDAGYVARPNLTAEKVTFTRKSKGEPSPPQGLSSHTGESRGYRAERPFVAATNRERLPGRIFMSYRRDDTAWTAGWLFDKLAEHFGADQVFKDVDSIDLGDDFAEVIKSAVSSCDALLALIGERWATITDEFGRRRLDNPEDFVRLEIEAALKRDVRVIPVLVGNARIPRSDQLPPSLAKLVGRQAHELSPNHFGSDTARLIKVLDRTLAEARAQRGDKDAAQTGPQGYVLSGTVDKPTKRETGQLTRPPARPDASLSSRVPTTPNPPTFGSKGRY